MKNKKKEKSFTQGPIMLGITIGLGLFVCTAAVMIGLSYLGLIGNEAIADTKFLAPDVFTRTLEDSMGVKDNIP